MKQKEKSDLQKFSELIMEMRTCILITGSLDGQPDARPMFTIEVDTDGTLWFFTDEFSKKVKEVSWNNKVFLTYANNEKNCYVVISGVAQVLNDRTKMEQLWNPLLKAWFPEGLNDQKITLLKVDPEKVEYWEGSSTKAGTLLNIIKSFVKGKQYDKGEHEQIVL